MITKTIVEIITTIVQVIAIVTNQIAALTQTLKRKNKQTQLEWFKVVASYLLSNIGIFALTVLYAIIGKCISWFNLIAYFSDSTKAQFILLNLYYNFLIE